MSADLYLLSALRTSGFDIIDHVLSPSASEPESPLDPVHPLELGVVYLYHRELLLSWASVGWVIFDAGLFGGIRVDYVLTASTIFNF